MSSLEKGEVMIKRKPKNETWNEFMDRAKHNRLSPTAQEQSDRQYETYQAGRKDMLREIEDRLIIPIIQAENDSIYAMEHEGPMNQITKNDKENFLKEAFAFATQTAIGGIEFRHRLEAAKKRYREHNL